MRWTAMGVLVLVVVSGCGGQRSSLLLERFARGPLEDAQTVARAIDWTLTPVVQTKTQEEVEVTVNHASREYLNNFFDNTNLFGPFAGRNPYYPEHLVFYVNLANRGLHKIQIEPDEFRLVDDRGNQLATIGVDYVTAFAEYRAPVATGTRSVVEGARPGYFGISLPLGNWVARKPQWRFALLKQSALQRGDLYPGVVHDGLIAFWNPSHEATKLSLLITNIKAGFDAKDEPKSSLEFVFEFDATHP